MFGNFGIEVELDIEIQGEGVSNYEIFVLIRT